MRFYPLYFYLSTYFSPIYLSKNISCLSKEIYRLLCSLFWGVSFVLYPISIEAFGVYNFSLILEICGTAILCLPYRFKRKHIKANATKQGGFKRLFLDWTLRGGGNVRRQLLVGEYSHLPQHYYCSTF